MCSLGQPFVLSSAAALAITSLGRPEAQAQFWRRPTKDKNADCKDARDYEGCMRYNKSKGISETKNNKKEKNQVLSDQYMRSAKLKLKEKDDRRSRKEISADESMELVKGAISDLTKAIEINPNNYSAYLLRGQERSYIYGVVDMLFYTDKFRNVDRKDHFGITRSEADRYLRSSIDDLTIVAENAHHQLRLEAYYWLTNVNENPDEVLSNYTKAIKLVRDKWPKKTFNWHNWQYFFYQRRGKFQLRKDKNASINDFGKAIYHYNQKNKLLPSPDKSSKLVELYSSRAKAYYNLNNRKKAIEDLKKIIELSSDSKIVAESYYRIGLIYYESNKLTDSILNYTKSIELDERNKRAYKNRGLAYEKMNDLAKACQDWRKAKDLGHKSVPILKCK